MEDNDKIELLTFKTTSKKKFDGAINPKVFI